jgi:uncharacterized protein (TIGR03000 family)
MGGEKLPLPRPDGKETMAPARARLIVELPADAKLYIDDRLMQTPSASRSFRTPELEQGQTYFYDLKTEYVRDGKTVKESRRVILHAGEVVRTKFTESEAPAVAAR